MALAFIILSSCTPSIVICAYIRTVYILMHRLAESLAACLHWVADNEDLPHSRATTWTWGTCQTATARMPPTRAPWVTGDTPSPLATSSGSLPRSPKAYFKPLWPFRSSPLDSSEVPLARKDNHPRAPDRAEDSRFPIQLLLSNKYFGTFHCFGSSITPPSLDQKSDRTL